MALKIDDFTPNSWSQGGSFAAFCKLPHSSVVDLHQRKEQMNNKLLALVISIVITILLCVIGWQVNNKYVLKDRVALATR